MINMRSGFAVLAATFLVTSGGAMAEVARVGLSSLPATMDPNAKTRVRCLASAPVGQI